MMRASWRRELVGVLAGEAKQRDLSWLDYSYPAGLSGDGKTLLFDEEGGGGSLAYSKSGGLSYAVYVRKTDGSPAVLFGRRRSVGLVARRKVGNCANPRHPFATKVANHRRRRSQGPDQGQREPHLGALVS